MGWNCLSIPKLQRCKTTDGRTDRQDETSIPPSTSYNKADCCSSLEMFNLASILLWSFSHNIIVHLVLVFQQQWFVTLEGSPIHYSDVIMSTMASQITSVLLVCSAICSDALQWCHNECDGISNHQHLDCLLSHFFRRRSKITSKLPVTGLCEGNSPVTGEFPAQRASNREYISIWWRHHVCVISHWPWKMW